MKFFKKNLLIISVLIIAGIFLFIPGVKTFLKDAFFPIADIENALKLDDKDYDIALKGMNVPDANLKDFKDKKTVFLNFWGTWCPPCIKEWPSIQKLYDSENGTVDFVLIAVQDDEAKVKAFLEKNKYTVPVYIAESPLSKNVLPSVFPTTFLLDIDGRILMKETSTKDWNTPAVHQFIKNVQR